MTDLLESICRRAGRSVRQSRETIIRQSRQRLSRDPFNRQAMHVVAASSLVHRQPEKALDLLAKTGEGLACDPVGNRLAGYAWLVNKDVSRAKQSFDQAVRLDPNQPDCWKWLGHLAEQDEQDEQAAEYYERGILFDDGGHESALALSRLHARNRQLKDAIHTLRVCLIRDRRSPKLNFALARLLDRRSVMLGRKRMHLAQHRLRREALECYRIVNAAAPTVQSWLMQGRLEQQLFAHAAARTAFQKAVDLDATSAKALSHLASANVDFGDIETALGQFEQSIRLDPQRGEAHFRYARAKRFKPGDSTQRYLDQLEQQLSIDDQPRQKKIYLNFAIAKLHDDIGNYDHAWQHYDRANRLKTSRAQSAARSKGPRRSPLQSDPAPIDPVEDGPWFEAFTRQSLQAYSPEYFKSMRGTSTSEPARPGIGHPSRTPIFIVGMPRSGTTLTEQILSSHPAIAGAGELNYINQLRQEIARVHSPSPDRQAAWSRHPEWLQSMNPAEMTLYAERYLEQLEQFRFGALHVTDKMPTNFMHLGLIATLFPNATVIHCRRNPMDVFVSCYCQNLNAPFCDLDQLAVYHRNYRRLMAHWERVLPIKIHTSDYESLVADPETQARDMIRHCGLPWDDACLQFHSNDRAVHTPSKWQVRQPMYRSSVEKWRRFEKHLAPIAEQVFAEIDAEAASALFEPSSLMTNVPDRNRSGAVHDHGSADFAGPSR
ncbi:tetratricopeptide repeat-containing sulfotransferase family protein [Rhodopirellula sp. JC639]|uniref:tetratricopeptide repeat-containing sulfotransferase family protein n=1 Tax=Stieleria mannarensis TaxID=2755585 RepID=UPI00160072C4|nr:tetratricopeptide repeat-containing sulfotransferase family protein [Rhodopirellula sp. JC639]